MSYVCVQRCLCSYLCVFRACGKQAAARHPKFRSSGPRTFPQSFRAQKYEVHESETAGRVPASAQETVQNNRQLHVFEEAANRRVCACASIEASIRLIFCKSVFSRGFAAFSVSLKVIVKHQKFRANQKQRKKCVQGPEETGKKMVTSGLRVARGSATCPI